jgi:hypothetical protein
MRKESAMASVVKEQGDERAKQAGLKDDLGAAARLFFGHTGPKVIAAAALAAIGVRVGLGAWSWWDLAVVVGMVAGWPLLEWCIHVFLLHFKPRVIAGVKVDPFVANKHRRHHADPWNISLSLTPLRGIALAIGINLALWGALMPTWSLAMTAVAFFISMGLMYEWTHFLIHTRYRPRTRLYKHLWRHHRLHHCKNENYWFGVSMTAGDTLLGTAPDHKGVETSETCKTVHAEV